MNSQAFPDSWVKTRSRLCQQPGGEPGWWVGRQGAGAGARLGAWESYLLPRQAKDSQASKGPSVRQAKDSQASKGTSVRQAKDSQASKGPLSGKQRTVRQAKDRRQASKGFAKACKGLAKASQGLAKALQRLCKALQRLCKALQRPCKGLARPCKGLAKACEGFACKGMQRFYKPIYTGYVLKLSLLFLQNT